MEQIKLAEGEDTTFPEVEVPTAVELSERINDLRLGDEENGVPALSFKEAVAKVLGEDEPFLFDTAGPSTLPAPPSSETPPPNPEIDAVGDKVEPAKE